VRFSGEIGFTDQVEDSPGVWKDVIIERSYFGDVIRDTRQLQDGQKVNDDISVQNSISVVDDGYAGEHIFAIRYIRWRGVLWKITGVEVQNPRLLLRLGSRYDGQTS
jgi:hypothetical protein